MMGTGRGLVNVKVFYAYFENAAILSHGMAGIGAEVHKNLMELGRIGKDGVIFRVQPAPDFNGSRHGRPQEPKHFFDNGSNGDGLKFPFRLSTERQYLVHQVCAPFQLPLRPPSGAVAQDALVGSRLPPAQ